MSKLMIVDGNSIANRAFYGIRPLTTKEGIPTNAIYGFLNILFKVKEEKNPDFITVAFDVSRKTFRNDMYEDYKANRKGMPDELAAQMPYLKEVLCALNIPYLEKEGYEADDIIGTVAKKCEEINVECDILTGDRDDLQLCSELTTVLLVTTKGGKTETVDYNPAGVMLKYEVSPKEFIDLKGLMGDSSDNIPGVKGVGEKTAVELIKEFKSIENLYANIDSDKIKASVRKKLIEDEKMAYLSKELATINCDVPIDFDCEAFKVKAPEENAIELFTKLEFATFIKKLNLTVREEKKVERPEFSSDFSIIEGMEKMYYMIIGESIYINTGSALVSGNLKENAHILKSFFEDKSVPKYTYGAKEDIILLFDMGIALKNIKFDIKLASYVLDPSQADLRIGTVVYNTVKEDVEEDCDAVSYFPAVCESLEDSLLDTNLIKLYYDIEMPVLKILAGMQIRGIKIDAEALESLSRKYEDRINELTGEIYELSGEEFNINSPKQLSVVLFEKLGLKAGKKTKTGYSTDNSVLENLKGENPVIEKLLEYRTVAKLKSTYVDSLLSLCDENNILHSKFHQTVTQTGRLSSSEPNLQNIPIRLELGREIRKLFTPAKDGNVFVSADYSQVELRVLAQICGDENLMNAFKNNEDIHAQAASKIFGVPLEEVTSKMRSDAKTVNFGILYGKTEFTLAKDLGISRKEAKDIIDTYLNKYPNIRAYMQDIVAYAKENGYVKTLLGRIRYIKELSDRNFMTRQAGERIALNTPIQGTAADIMKIAMIKTQKKLNELELDARIVLQIHDELVIEATKENYKKVEEVLRECMESAVKINVPLTVSVGSGVNLYELK